MGKIHGEHLRQLTGCRYPVIVMLQRKLERTLLRRRRGRPYRHSVRTMLVVALARLRGGQAYRSMMVHWKIPYVTLHRYTLLVCSLLARCPLAGSEGHSWLLVDSTSVRIRSRTTRTYSGYKHHHCLKVQVMADDHGRIVDVSPPHPGAVHDKTIWNQELDRTGPLLDRPVLGDRAYAGAAGEGRLLFRPIRRNERIWREDTSASRAFNRALCRIRVRVEHVFARMKAFAIIRGQFPMHPERFGVVMRALAVVHNAILDTAHTKPQTL